MKEWVVSKLVQAPQLQTQKPVRLPKFDRMISLYELANILRCEIQDYYKMISK